MLAIGCMDLPSFTVLWRLLQKRKRPRLWTGREGKLNQNKNKNKNGNGNGNGKRKVTRYEKGTGATERAFMRIPKVHFGFGIKTHLLGTADVRYDEKWDYLAFSWDGTGYHRAELGERANWIDSGLRCFDLVYFFLICFASRFHVLFSLRASSVLLPSPVPLSSSPRAQCCSSGTAYGTTFLSRTRMGGRPRRS